MKAIKRVAAILSIVVAACMVFLLLTSISNEISNYLSNRRYYNAGNPWSTKPSLDVYLIVVASIVVAVNIPIVVLGGLFCRNKPDKGIAISLLAFIGASFASTVVLLAGSNLSSYFSSFMSAFLYYYAAMIAVIVLTIIYLCNLGSNKNWHVQAAANENYVTAPPIVSSAATATITFEQKIAILKQLKSDGTLTDAEYKKRILEIVDSK